jgi:CheY-like chemotaxis protein
MPTKTDGDKTILIVDDELDVVSYLEMLLADAGYRTLSAVNGNEGMALARREHPDLVVLDISMPQASGSRMYRDLKADPALAGTPVVIVTGVTGYGGDPYGFEKFLAGRRSVPPPEGFLPKPIEQTRFLEVVRALLSGGVREPVRGDGK